MEYGRRLTGVKHQQELGELLTDELPHELCVQHADLLLPEDYKLSSVGDANSHLPISHAAVRWVASGGEAQLATRVSY